MSISCKISVSSLSVIVKSMSSGSADDCCVCSIGTAPVIAGKLGTLDISVVCGGACVELSSSFMPSLAFIMLLNLPRSTGSSAAVLCVPWMSLAFVQIESSVGNGRSVRPRLALATSAVTNSASPSSSSREQKTDAGRLRRVDSDWKYLFAVELSAGKGLAPSLRGMESLSFCWNGHPCVFGLGYA